MAITNAQQARQLYKNGGTMEDIGFSIVKPSKDGSRPGYAFAGTGGNTGSSGGPPGGGDAKMKYNANFNIHQNPDSTPDTSKISPIQQYNHDVVQGNTDPSKVDPPELIQRDLDFIANKKKKQQDKQRRMLEIANRGGGNNYVPLIIPEEDDEEDEEVNPRDYTGIAPRFMGSIFDFTGLADGGRAGAMDGGRMKQIEMMEEEDTPEGGIMDLESGRQMYFLGKLVKKATRAVKKIVKSPVGKAALMYFGGQALMGAGGGSGIFSGLKGKLFGQLASKAAGPMKYLQGTPFTKGLFGKLGLTTGGGSMMPTLKGGLSLGLGIPFALDALGVGKEEEDGFDIDEYYKTQGIDIDAIRNNPNRILARRFMAEGGDAEPVAKKTMPLIDMDGQEMDLREDGGFVPLGRMERADDVPARLSKNEFVFTADAVRNAGEGDIDKGAEVMYNMMKNLESGGEVSEESQGLDGAREMFKTSQRLEEVL